MSICWRLTHIKTYYCSLINSCYATTLAITFNCRYNTNCLCTLYTMIHSFWSVLTADEVIVNNIHYWCIVMRLTSYWMHFITTFLNFTILDILTISVVSTVRPFEKFRTVSTPFLFWQVWTFWQFCEQYLSHTTICYLNSNRLQAW